MSRPQLLDDGIPTARQHLRRDLRLGEDVVRFEVDELIANPEQESEVLVRLGTPVQTLSCEEPVRKNELRFERCAGLVRVGHQFNEGRDDIRLWEFRNDALVPTDWCDRPEQFQSQMRARVSHHTSQHESNSREEQESRINMKASCVSAALKSLATDGISEMSEPRTPHFPRSNR